MPRHLRTYSYPPELRGAARQVEAALGSPPRLIAGSTEELRLLAALAKARIPAASTRVFECLHVAFAELAVVPFVHLLPMCEPRAEAVATFDGACACPAAWRQLTKLVFDPAKMRARDLMVLDGRFWVASRRLVGILDAAGVQGCRSVPCLDSRRANPPDTLPLEARVPLETGDPAYFQIFFEDAGVVPRLPRTASQVAPPNTCAACGRRSYVPVLYPQFPFALIRDRDFVRYDRVDFASGERVGLQYPGVVVSTRLVDLFRRERVKGWCPSNADFELIGAFLDEPLPADWRFAPFPRARRAGPSPRRTTASRLARPTKRAKPAYATQAALLDAHSSAFAKLAKEGLGPVADRLRGLARPSIRLRAVARDDDEIPIGSSKLGGEPDLADGSEWPSWEGKPLSFLAQLDLEEVAPFDLERLLPTTGRLLFFYDAAGQPWGGQAADRGRWRVLWNPAGEALVRTAPPDVLPPVLELASRVVRLEVELTLPALDRATTSRGLDVKRDALLVEWTDRHFPTPEHTKTHRLLGHADVIQGEIEIELGDDWTLLLQLDSEDVSWGDAGRLYFWIRRDDLARGSFAEIAFRLQCY